MRGLDFLANPLCPALGRLLQYSRRRDAVRLRVRWGVPGDACGLARSADVGHAAPAKSATASSCRPQRSPDSLDQPTPAHRLRAVVFCRPSAVPIAERHTRTSQVKALPPEVVSVSPARRGFPLPCVMRPTSVASEADMKPGNRKGTNPGPPSRSGRTRHTAVVLRTPRPVLNSTAANCGPPFGTKGPQVQILSPRLYSRRSEALTRVGEGLSCCQYRCKIPHVPQQIRTLTCSSNGFPQPAQRFAGTKRPRARTCDPDQSSRRSWLKERARRRA